jgi:hypothetical protein
LRVGRFDDDDDWVGTPPEGRYTRDRARPDYWRRAWPVQTVFFGVLAILVVVVIVLALR